MAGEVVPLKPSANADKETKAKERLLRWRSELADKVIEAARADVALHFLDTVDDEESSALDLNGDYDPIVDAKTGMRLTDAITEFSEEIGLGEKELRRLYENTLRAKFKAQKQADHPTEPPGKRYGKNHLVNPHGVWTRLHVGGPDLFVWRRVTRTRIDHVALSYDTSPHQNWRHHYLITGETGELSVSIGVEKLGKDANSAITILMKCGAHVVESKEARQHLAVFLRYKPRARIVRAPRVGWFELRKNNWLFVLPDETLGDVGRLHSVVLDTASKATLAHHGFHRSGTSEQWREQVAKPLAGNSNVLLAVGTFLAAPLLRFADEAAGGFHLHGHSKVGKTLAGAIAQSIWGKPLGAGTDTFGFTWELTSNRIGERAVLRSDVGMYLDEIGIGDQRAIAKTIYKLAGGLDKGRYGASERDFNILFLSTGELSLMEFLSDARQGQLVRMVDVPAEIRTGTAFETIAESDIATAGRRFYSATAEYHGTVGYDWLRRLVALGPKQIKAELKQLREAWWALPQVVEIAHRANPQVVSVVNRFALVAAALTMASAARIVPWAVDDINAGIIGCMSRWLQQRGNIDTAGETLRQIKQRQHEIAVSLDFRFIHLRIEGHRLVPASEADQRKIEAEHNGEQKFNGYIKDEHVLVWPEAWHRLWAGLDADVVKKCLRQTGLLIADPSDQLSLQKYKSKTRPARFYVLARAMIART